MILTSGCAYAPTARSSSLNAESSDSPHISDNIIILDDYWKHKIAAIETITLEEIYAISESLVESGAKIIVKNNLFTDHYVRYNFSNIDKIRYDEESFIAQTSSEKTDLEKEVDIYLVFLGTLTEAFKDCCYYDDYDHAFYLNRNMAPVFVFSLEYKDLGYISMDDYYKSIIENNIENASKNTYFVNFEGFIIEHCNEVPKRENNIYYKIKMGGDIG